MLSTRLSDYKNTVMDVLILEDSSLLRGMLIDVLASVAGIRVVGEAEDEATGLELTERLKPDLVIIDLELVTGSGIGYLTRLREHQEIYGSPLAVIFSNHSSAILRRRCESIGIDGYFDKSYQLEELISFIHNQCD